jgi:Domain of unknown function (DUF4288)
MMWYAAHVIMYVVFKDGQQGNYTVWENVFLVEGTDDRVALKKAEDLGRNARGRCERQYELARQARIVGICRSPQSCQM